MGQQWRGGRKGAAPFPAGMDISKGAIESGRYGDVVFDWPVLLCYLVSVRTGRRMGLLGPRGGATDSFQQNISKVFFRHDSFAWVVE